MSPRRIILLALLPVAVVGWWLWPNAQPSYPITNAPPPAGPIIAFGDSLTAGQGAARGRSYPDQLSQRLGVDVINAGVSGNTTAAALARIPRDVLAKNPAIVLVCLGANDMMQKLPVDQAIENLRRIVQRLQDAGALVILIGLDLPRGYRNARFAELARQTGCPFVPDVMRGILGRPSLSGDAAHPNGDGYTLMVERITPVLERYLADTPAR